MIGGVRQNSFHPWKTGFQKEMRYNSNLFQASEPLGKSPQYVFDDQMIAPIFN